jgi:hypothetical protein
MPKAPRTPAPKAPGGPAPKGAKLIETLKARFQDHMERHEGIDWTKVQARLEAEPDKLKSLGEMERTGGEPDVIGRDRKTGEYLFCDCAEQTPEGRRNVCFDRKGQDAREKEGIDMAGNAIDMAADIGIELLTEEEYRALQELGEFDTRTSSWLATPAAIRKLGGALFGDRRYDTVFTYHNGAQSFYRGRGFRGILRV